MKNLILILNLTIFASLSYAKDFNKIQKIIATGLGVEVNIPKGKGLKVAIIDTGIDYKNPFFKNSFLKKENGEPFYGYDLVENDILPQDVNGHGTNVASIFVALCPSIKILPIRYVDGVLSSSGNIVNAIKIAISHNVDVINFSGGGTGFQQREYDAIKEAGEKGIIFVTAAGNYGTKMAESPYYPAAYKLNNIISVNSKEANGKLSYFSNYGNEVDFMAKGSNIKALGETTGVLKTLTGTSQAAPQVGAIVAHFRGKYPKMSAKYIKWMILAQTKSRFPEAKGSIDLNKIFRRIASE